MIRPLLQFVSPPAAAARLSILIFHRVHLQPDPLLPGDVDAQRFRQICTWLREWFNVMSLDQALKHLREGCLPARAATITFDDGYADNHNVALPILSDLGLTATFFIATGYLDGGRMWNDTLVEAVRRCKSDVLDLSRSQVPALVDLGQLPVSTHLEKLKAIQLLIRACRYLAPDLRQHATAVVESECAAQLPNDLMMSRMQVRTLAARCMGIGGHTVTHPILMRIQRHEARQEMTAGKAELESVLQQRVSLFAYPNGKPGHDFAPDHVSLAREVGFDAAVTTAWGSAGAGTDPYELPRFTPWDRNKHMFGLRLVRNIAQSSANLPQT